MECNTLHERYGAAKVVKKIFSNYKLNIGLSLVVEDSDVDKDEEELRINSHLDGDLYYIIDDFYGSKKIRYFKKVKDNKKTMRVQELITHKEDDIRIEQVLTPKYVTTKGELANGTWLVDKETLKVTDRDAYNMYGKELKEWDGLYFKTDWMGDNIYHYRMEKRQWENIR